MSGGGWRKRPVWAIVSIAMQRNKRQMLIRHRRKARKAGEKQRAAHKSQGR